MQHPEEWQCAGSLCVRKDSWEYVQALRLQGTEGSLTECTPTSPAQGLPKCCLHEARSGKLTRYQETSSAPRVNTWTSSSGEQPPHQLRVPCQGLENLQRVSPFQREKPSYSTQLLFSPCIHPSIICPSAHKSIHPSISLAYMFRAPRSLVLVTLLRSHCEKFILQTGTLRHMEVVFAIQSAGVKSTYF